MRNNSVTHRSGNKNALTFQKRKRNVVSKQEQFHFFIIIFSLALDGIFTTLDPLFCTAVYSDYSWGHYLVQPPNCAGATRTMSCLQIQSQHEHGLTPTGRGVYFLFCALLCQLNSLSIFRKREKKKLLTNTKELGYTAELHTGTETVLQEKYTQTHEHLLIVCYGQARASLLHTFQTHRVSRNQTRV